MSDDYSRHEESECTDSSCCHADTRTSNRSQKSKAALAARLNRIEGQIRGIKGMIERDVYCDDILNQISSVQSAIKSVSRLLLEGHMKSCIVSRIQAGENEVLDELLETIEKMMK
ncbi:MAG: metal-sensitive transcriptional regulator [Bacillota bacterium]